MKNIFLNLLRRSITLLRARSRLAYPYGLSRCALRGLLRLSLLATIDKGFL